jgi:hypothetical protein
MKFLILILLILVSCKPHQGGSGGGGGGSVPTADDLNNYIDRLTTPENKTCGDVVSDRQRPGKFPIIYPSSKKAWKNEFSEAISEQFEKDYMRPLKQQKIDEGDLSLLGCKGYNYATDPEKKQFWILFLSAVSKPESNFDPDEEYRETNGTVSTGMLQIDPRASNQWCGVLSKDMKKSNFVMSDMHNPKTNLQCGLVMMQWQVLGVPKQPDMRQTRPDLKGRLFTDNSYWYWSTLSNKNSSGKREVIDWFRVHAQRQLKFCNRTNPIDGYTPGLSSKYKEMDCEEVLNPTEKSNCEKYLLNIKLEEKTFEPRLGENPIEDSCKIIDNSGRQIFKRTLKDRTVEDGDESSNISK